MFPFSSFSSPSFFSFSIHHLPVQERSRSRERDSKTHALKYRETCKFHGEKKKKEKETKGFRYQGISDKTVPITWLLSLANSYDTRATSGQREVTNFERSLYLGSRVCTSPLAPVPFSFPSPPSFLFALSFNIVAEAPDSIICEVRIREAGGPAGVVVGRRAHRI